MMYLIWFHWQNFHVILTKNTMAFPCISLQLPSNLLRDYLSDNFLFLMIIVFIFISTFYYCMLREATITEMEKQFSYKELKVLKKKPATE